MVHEKGVVPEHIIHTPVWVTIIRGIQFFLAIVILGISAWLIHGAYIEELGFAIAVVRLPLPFAPRYTAGIC